MSTAPRAVVLDLGNVLIRWEPTAAIAAGVGEEQARAFLDPATSGVDFGAWNHRQDVGDSWDDGEAWLAAHHPDWVEHGRAYRRHFARSLTGLVEGTAGVVRELVGRGVPTYALTNWSAELYPVAVERFAELALFEDVVVSGQVGVAKPERAVFDLCARRIDQAPGEIFFTDDSPANVAAAREAGWHAELFTTASTLRRQLVGRRLLVD